MDFVLPISSGRVQQQEQEQDQQGVLASAVFAYTVG
jgi:hypothetical protein